MKKLFIAIAFVLSLLLSTVYAQQTANAADSLDLNAVGELFRDSDSLEEFERSLNDSANGVNNLDLDEDDAVDYIRVTEQARDSAHLIVLQTEVSENDFQDVATIAVERARDDYNLQIQGDKQLYGADYYVVPANRNFGAWNVIKRIFSPDYRVYVSPYRYRSYPKWFAARRPAAVGVYRARVGALAGRRNFSVSRAGVVRAVGEFDYRPKRSVRVVKKRTTTTTVTNPRGSGNQRVKETTTVTRTRKGRRN